MLAPASDEVKQKLNRGLTLVKGSQSLHGYSSNALPARATIDIPLANRILTSRATRRILEDVVSSFFRSTRECRPWIFRIGIGPSLIRLVSFPSNPLA